MVDRTRELEHALGNGIKKEENEMETALYKDVHFREAKFEKSHIYMMTLLHYARVRRIAWHHHS